MRLEQSSTQELPYISVNTGFIRAILGLWVLLPFLENRKYLVFDIEGFRVMSGCRVLVYRVQGLTLLLPKPPHVVGGDIGLSNFAPQSGYSKL